MKKFLRNLVVHSLSISLVLLIPLLLSLTGNAALFAIGTIATVISVFSILCSRRVEVYLNSNS